MDSLPGSKQFEIIKFLALDYCRKIFEENEVLKKEIKRIKHIKPIECKCNLPRIVCISCHRNYCIKCETGILLEYDKPDLDGYGFDHYVFRLCNHCFVDGYDTRF